MKLTACNENNTLFSDKSQVIITKNRGLLYITCQEEGISLNLRL